MLRKLLVASIIPALFLLVLEGVFRYFEPSPESLGVKAPGVFRIVAIGGSTVEGVPLPEAGLVAQLQAALGDGYQVVNLGIGGKDSVYVRDTVQWTVAHGEPDLLLVLTAHNEFLDRRQGAVVEWGDWAARHSALARALRGLSSPPMVDPRPPKLVPVEREGEWFRERLARHRANLESIVEVAGEVPLILATGPSNLRDWPPVHHSLDKSDPDYARHVTELKELLAQGRFEEALSRCRALEGEFGEDAMYAWLAGRALLGLGRPAAQELERAKELDPFPWRALKVQNDAIREIAGERLVDFEKTLEDAAPGGLVGFGLIDDNVHPSPAGNQLMGQAVLEKMAADGLLGGVPELELPLLDEKLEARRLLNLGIYCVKVPFFYYGAARDYLARAAALDPDNWIVQANLGVSEYLTGNLEAARDSLALAEKLKGKPLEAADQAEVPYLLEALKE